MLPNDCVVSDYNYLLTVPEIHTMENSFNDPTYLPEDERNSKPDFSYGKEMEVPTTTFLLPPPPPPPPLLPPTNLPPVTNDVPHQIVPPFDLREWDDVFFLENDKPEMASFDPFKFIVELPSDEKIKKLRIYTFETCKKENFQNKLPDWKNYVELIKPRK